MTAGVGIISSIASHGGSGNLAIAIVIKRIEGILAVLPPLGGDARRSGLTR
jgi:hypothetical protein